jgi:uncharacterized circularly permuted ATP-grasp superfamily protein
MAGLKTPRAEFAALSQWIDDTPDAANCSAASNPPKPTFRQLGITFAVYGDSDASERIIPFDIVPRVFLADEWARLSEGLIQRVEAINAVPRRHLWRAEDPRCRRACIPPDLIFGNDAVPPRNRRHAPAARHLGAYLRHRSGAHRPGRILRAGG